MSKITKHLQAALLALIASAVPAIACTLPPDWKPPSVEELFEMSVYVIYAKGYRF